MTRLFDVIFSLAGLVLLSPMLLVIAVWIRLDSSGPAIFRQVRVGRYGKTFELLKFRSMRPGSEAKGQLTVGTADSRITRIGAWLRRYKLDELPQLVNVLKGEMSIVGPRPEVPKYVAYYTPEQRRVLDVRPGITDHASLEYFEENKLLAQSSDPEHTYIHEVMPAKIRLNMRYIERPTLAGYFSIIVRTALRIVR